MLFAKKVNLKMTQIRKQNWSAPAIMTVFILICMFIVFSFETIGILRRESNLDHRIIYINKGINLFMFYSLKLVTIKGQSNKDIQINDYTESITADVETITSKIKIDTIKKKEETNEKMMKMLYDAINPSEANFA